MFLELRLQAEGKMPGVKPGSDKSIIFWDMTPYSPTSVNRRFGGT
jgi:hypothetical protein